MDMNNDRCTMPPPSCTALIQRNTAVYVYLSTYLRL
jgi:hypothetical protein